jgi:hypothetical protein
VSGQGSAKAFSARDLGIGGPRPFLYYVLADLPDAPRDNMPAIVGPEGADFSGFSSTTYPHQFDKQLTPAATALIAYILNLPRAPLDLYRTHEGGVPAPRQDTHAHAIYILPVQHVRHLFPLWVPALILAPDALLDEARQFAAATRAMLGAVGLAALSPELVVEHWRQLWRLYCDPRHFVPVAPRPLLDLSRIAGELPARYRARGPADTRLASPGAEGHGQKGSGSLSLVCPGVAGLYKRSLKYLIRADADDTRDFQERVAADALIERDVFSLLATHSALRDDGDALLLPELPRSAFGALTRAERGFASKTFNPRGVWSALTAISEAFRRTTTPEVVSRIEGAKALKVFSNFPVGLADPGSRGTPLALRTPIAYVPLQGLTSSLTYELRTVPKTPLHKHQPSILFAECIPPDDPVGVISRQGTARIVTTLKRTRRFQVDAIDAPDAATLRRALKRKESIYDVLVLSAHGATDPDTGTSGILCGKRVVTGYELERTARVVILSACQVNPMGHGTTSIVAELLNVGALAVAGTMVPICVHRNMLLLERLLKLLADWTAGDKRSNFLEIWWSALYYTSAMDVVLSDPGLTDWILASESTCHEVMQPVFDRMTSAVKSTSAYDFYEQAFQQIADADSRRPEGSILTGRQWRDFVLPESLMYMIFGWPENIIV